MSWARSARPTRASWAACRSRVSRGPKSVQGAMVGEVLRDAEIGIERALLKNDPEQRERRAALSRDISARQFAATPDRLA